MTKRRAAIVSPLRTPVGRFQGTLAPLNAGQLGAAILKALVERTGIDANLVDDVVWGCCDTIWPQAGDIGRTVWLVAGLVAWGGPRIEPHLRRYIETIGWVVAVVILGAIAWLNMRG